MTYSKAEVVGWIVNELDRHQRGHGIRVPCVDGLRAVLGYLSEDAPTPTRRVTFTDGSPVMPAEPSQTVLGAMACTTSHDARVYYRRIRNALMQPPEPETKTVWCVAWNYRGEPRIRKFETEERANLQRDQARMSPNIYTNISPVWSQVVPAQEE